MLRSLGGWRRSPRRNLLELSPCYRPATRFRVHTLDGPPAPRSCPRKSVKAFVLIVVDPAKTIDVFNKLNAVVGISEVYQVMGPYDIVAVVDVANLSDVPSVISRHIRAVDGIESTTTCVTFPETG